MSKNRDVIILGSGMSILELSPSDIDYINNCEVIIAINKFMAFYKKSGIVPNHIYYVDNYQESVKIFLKYIFDTCRKDNLKNLTFILNQSLLQGATVEQAFQHLFTSNSFFYWLRKIYRKIKYGKKEKDINLFLIPSRCHFDFITHQDWISGDQWATSLQEPLFHYRGSLSTVLNYISIRYPNRKVYLVGVDFNSPQYFFQEELENLNINWQDWTTSIVKEKKKHFSAIEFQGTTIFDKFEFMLDYLALSGNSIFSYNPNSLLVEKGFIKYDKLNL